MKAFVAQCANRVCTHRSCGGSSREERMPKIRLTVGGGARLTANLITYKQRKCYAILWAFWTTLSRKANDAPEKDVLNDFCERAGNGITRKGIRKTKLGVRATLCVAFYCAGIVFRRHHPWNGRRNNTEVVFLLVPLKDEVIFRSSGAEAKQDWSRSTSTRSSRCVGVRQGPKETPPQCHITTQSATRRAGLCASPPC